MVQRPRCFLHPLPPSTGGRRPACLQHLRHHKHARNTPTDWARLDYLSVEELQALLSPRFDILYAEEEVISLPFPTPQAVLKHLKQTGVTGTEKRMWTRSRLQSFCKEYTTRFSDAAGNVSLTYHPIYIIARKKQNNGNKNIYFISGIDTDAGKSYCTVLVCP